jgi:hypothetical protein
MEHIKFVKAMHNIHTDLHWKNYRMILQPRKSVCVPIWLQDVLML